jgi:DNA-binding IscR family transcriptional regulator
MISKKAKYALKALKVLAQSYEKGPLLISHIAESERIPKKFLEAILLELRNHGI